MSPWREESVERRCSPFSSSYLTPIPILPFFTSSPSHRRSSSRLPCSPSSCLIKVIAGECFTMRLTQTHSQSLPSQCQLLLADIQRHLFLPNWLLIKNEPPRCDRRSYSTNTHTHTLGSTHTVFVRLWICSGCECSVWITNASDKITYQC